MTYALGNESILAVLVLYGREIEQAESIYILLELLNDSGINSLCLKHILIYDNSDFSHASKLFGSIPGLTYMHNRCNGGTVAAYTEAAELAEKIAADWLLLLDQDTKLPLSYLSSMASKLKSDSTLNIGALVPYVRNQTEFISPALITKIGSIKPIKRSCKTNHSDIVTGISSGAIVKRQLLKKIFPMPSGLWLDYVDHYIFYRLNKLGYRVIATDIIIEHELSIKSLAGISENRLLSILNGEYIFIKMLGWHAMTFYPVRFFFRLLRYAKTNSKLVVPMLTWLFSAKK